MEVEEIQAQEWKFQRVGVAANGRPDKINNTDDKQDRDLKMVGADDDLLLAGRLRGWPQSSRIIRASRASGGKDRHSKVWTSKGLRDRRVRLSVNTAIQFYDLQDRLGYDQPSKAVEWLINAASDSIAELPALDSPFPQTPRQPNDEKRSTEQAGLDSADFDRGDAAAGFRQQQHNLSLSKSGYSSTSETSKGSRFDIRVKRRERARETTDKEKENETHHHHNQNVNPISQTSSFTELLAGAASGGISIESNHAVTASPSAQLEPSFFQYQAARQWPTAQIDYFGSHSSAFPGHIMLGNSLPQAFNNGREINSEMQHFPFVTDYHLMNTSTSHQQPNAANRGTLQSNSLSPSLMMPHFQRFLPIDGSLSHFPFFIGTAAAAAAAAPPIENN